MSISQAINTLLLTCNSAEWDPSPARRTQIDGEGLLYHRPTFVQPTGNARRTLLVNWGGPGADGSNQKEKDYIWTAGSRAVYHTFVLVRKADEVCGCPFTGGRISDTFTAPFLVVCRLPALHIDDGRSTLACDSGGACTHSKSWALF